MKKFYFVMVMCLVSATVMGAYTQGIVDLDNLQALANDWLDPADMDDFAFMAAVWQTDQTPPEPDIHWPLDETSGPVATDIVSGYELVPATGIGLDLTIENGSVPARIERGIKFTGTNRMTAPGLDSGNPPGPLDVIPDELTIMGWLRPMPGNSTAPIWLGKNNTDNTPSAGFSISQLYLRAGSNSSTGARIEWKLGSISQPRLYSGVTLNDDTWYHYAFTWDADGMAIYIDGQLGNTNTVDITGFSDSDTGDTGDYDMHLGSGWVHVSPFTGVIDDVKIFYNKLSEVHIANVYDAYAPLTTYDLIVTDGPHGSGAAGSVMGTLNDIEYTVTAGTPDSGYSFAGWIGDIEFLDNPNAASTTILMPTQNVTVTARYEVPYVFSLLTVNNGTPSGNYYPQNTVVDIVADTPNADEIFTGWTGDIATVADVSDPTTTITIPGVDITVTANYANIATLLAVHWPLEETSGTISDNVAGVGNDLVAINTYSIADMSTTGKVNNAFTFTDDSKALEIKGLVDSATNQPDVLDVFPDEITVMGWVKITDGTNDDSIFLSKKPISNWGFYTIVDDDYFDVSLQWNSSGRSNRISGTTVNPVSDTWYHYAMTWVGTDMRLYIDGVQDGVTYTGADIADFPDAVNGGGGYDTTVGAGWAHVQAYAGVLDELKIYTVALTATQIEDIYDSY